MVGAAKAEAVAAVAAVLRKSRRERRDDLAFDMGDLTDGS
jgi:hypothetical protein